MVNHVREIRSRQGLSQKDLAKKADICQSLLSAIEIGRVIPGGKDMRRIAKALRVSVIDVFSKEEREIKKDSTESLAAPVESNSESMGETHGN